MTTTVTTDPPPGSHPPDTGTAAAEVFALRLFLRPRDVISVGTIGLRVKRMRTALTALGIAIGISAMVAVVGISASSRADLLAELDELGTNLLQVAAGQLPVR